MLYTSEVSKAEWNLVALKVCHKGD